MTNAHEDAMEQRLRWMTENLNGAYNARHPEGHPNAGDHCTNSGTCIIVCCYINALGKVLWGRLTLNINELVRGFHRGIEEFRRLADTDTELRSRFIEFIVV